MNTNRNATRAAGPEASPHASDAVTKPATPEAEGLFRPGPVVQRPGRKQECGEGQRVAIDHLLRAGDAAPPRSARIAGKARVTTYAHADERTVAVTDKSN